LLLVCLLFSCLFYFSDEADDFVYTPVGLFPKQCVHQVLEQGTHIIDSGPEGVEIVHEGAKQSVMLKPCTKKPKNQIPTNKNNITNWQVWTSYNTTSIDSFTGFFEVPEKPKVFGNSSHGIIYIFNALQSDSWIPNDGFDNVPDGFSIIQPVLQYGGDSNNGGGEYWGLASWYATISGDVLFSKEIPLNPGDVVFSNMTRIGEKTWFIGGSKVGEKRMTSVTVTRDTLKVQPWAFTSLEVYDIDSCSWFPAPGSSFSFFGMSLLDSFSQPLSPDWVPGSQNFCNISLQVLEPATVRVDF